MEIPEEITLIEKPNTTQLLFVARHPKVYDKDRMRLLKYMHFAYNGKVEVKYARKKYNGNCYGRYFPTNGKILYATYQWRKVRATLFSDTHYDIDIVNCHPVLLEQLHKRYNNEPTPFLSYYINNRDNIIAECQVSQAAIDRYNKSKSDCATKKDVVKKLFTIILYGGGINTFEEEFGINSSEYTLPDFFYNFKYEIERITHNIINSRNDFIKQLVLDYREQETGNVRDSAILSLILQDLETRIITCAMQEFKTLSDAEIAVYAFDGFMVTKTKENINETCERLGELVQARSGYLVRFINKPFEEKLLPEKIIPPVIDITNKETVNDFLKVQVNEIYPLLIRSCAFITNSGRSRWLFKKLLNDELTYETIPTQALLARTKSTIKIVDAPDKKKSKCYRLYDCLIKIQELVQYDYEQFIPYARIEDSPEGIFNLFTGFKHVLMPEFAVNQTIIEPILTHIFNIWCCRDEITFNYVINWFAHIVQTPRIKTDTALVLKSTHQGAGKSIVCDFICNKVIGEKYTTTISDSSKLVGRFNVELQYKLLTVLDEVTEQGAFYQFSDKLKAMITQKTVSIEKKGIDAVKNRDYNNYIFLTNNTMPIKVEATDRRYLTLEVSNEKANNAEYFDGLLEIMTDECGLHFYHMLMQRNITGFKFNQIPNTKLRTELKMANVGYPIMFLIKVAKRETEIPTERDTFHISTAALFSAFKSWADSQSIVHKFNSITFGKEIKKIIEAGSIRDGATVLWGYNYTYEELKNKCCEYIKADNLDDIQ